jgi:hypothetical protein
MSEKISKKTWKLVNRLTPEQAKQFDEAFKKLEKDVENKLFVPVAEMVVKTLFAIAQKNVKVAELVFVKQENGKVNVELRIGGVRFIDGEGKETVIANTSAIKTIEGGINDEKES